MKRIIFSLLLISAVFTTNAQTADEIISKHIEAIGGVDAWKKVNSMVSTGSIKIQGADIAIAMTILNGKGSRQDITAMGMNGYQIITPSQGWNFMPFQGQKAPEPVTADDLKEAQENLDVQGTLIDYKSKGHTVELLGKDDVEGVEAFKIKQTLKSGKVLTLFFDPTTYYLLKSISKQKANGKEVDVPSNFSNYQKLPEGIFVPMSISLPFGELVLNKVEINNPVDENIFQPAK